MDNTAQKKRQIYRECLFYSRSLGLAVFPSTIAKAGWGLYAIQSFASEIIVGEYTGDYINNAEFSFRYGKVGYANAVRLSSNQLIDGTPSSPTSCPVKYINHFTGLRMNPCTDESMPPQHTPNAELRIHANNGKLSQVFLHTLTVINASPKKPVELLCDYAAIGGCTDFEDE